MISASLLVAVVTAAGVSFAVARDLAAVPIPDAITVAANVQMLAMGIDPNTASAAELTTLPGIGDAKAKRIIAYRKKHAGATPAFTRPEDLAEVHGIGPRTVEKLRSRLRFHRPRL